MLHPLYQEYQRIVNEELNPYQLVKTEQEAVTFLGEHLQLSGDGFRQRMQAYGKSPDVRIKGAGGRAVAPETSSLRLKLAETRNQKILEAIEEEERKERKR